MTPTSRRFTMAILLGYLAGCQGPAGDAPPQQPAPVCVDHVSQDLKAGLVARWADFDMTMDTVRQTDFGRFLPGAMAVKAVEEVQTWFFQSKADIPPHGLHQEMYLHVILFEDCEHAASAYSDTFHDLQTLHQLDNRFAVYHLADRWIVSLHSHGRFEFKTWPALERDLLAGLRDAWAYLPAFRMECPPEAPCAIQRVTR